MDDARPTRLCGCLAPGPSPAQRIMLGGLLACLLGVGVVRAHGVSTASQHASEQAGVKEEAALEPTHARPRLVVLANEASPGSSVQLLLHWEIDRGWHLYFNGPNEAGMEPTWTLELPAGWSMGEARWPVPRRKVSNEITVEHIYERALTLALPVVIPSDAKPGAYTLTGTLKWIVCEDVCVAESADVSVVVRVGAQSEPIANASGAGTPPPRIVPPPEVAGLNSPRAQVLGLSLSLDAAGGDEDGGEDSGEDGGEDEGERGETLAKFTGGPEVEGLAFFPEAGSSEIVTDALAWQQAGRRLELRLKASTGNKGEPITNIDQRPNMQTGTQDYLAHDAIALQGFLEVVVRKAGATTREYFRIDATSLPVSRLK